MSPISPGDSRVFDHLRRHALSIVRLHVILLTTICLHAALSRPTTIGASLGALEGAHLSVIGAEERTIGIKKYLLVNPPLDLAYAVKKIDEWHALEKRFGKNKSDTILARVIGEGLCRFTTE